MKTGKVFGDNLKRLRETRGMTRGDLAKAMGWSRRTIQDLEDNTTRYNRDHVDAACRVLGVKPLDLLESPEAADMVTRALTPYESWIVDTARTQGAKALVLHLLTQMENPETLPEKAPSPRTDG